MEADVDAPVKKRGRPKKEVEKAPKAPELTLAQRLAVLDRFKPLLLAAPFTGIRELWAELEVSFGEIAVGWLGRHDRFYLLTKLLHRSDAVHPWIYARCREVELDPDGYLDLWAREHYKMLRTDEPVPTPSGWTTHGALRHGDWVYGPDGMPTRVVACTEVFTEGDAFELSFDDGTVMQAGADHLWDVERKTRKRIAGTSNGRQYREAVTLSTRDIHSHQHTADNRLAIPVNAPLNMPDALLPIEPYTLGAWLGDGSAADGRITGEDQAIFDAIKAEGYIVGPDAAPSKPNAVTRTVYGLRPLLRGLRILGDKHIPVFYQRGSTRQRMELLRGLMDTDGHCNTRGTATFTNTNERLVHDVYELATGLGLKPSVYEYKNEFGPVWQVAFQAYQEANPFRLPRKAARAKPGARPHPRRYIVDCTPIAPVPMSCIQVERPDGLYLAGRQMVTTHNSTIITFAGIIQEIIIDPEVTVGIFSHTKPIARKFMLQIKLELETNRELQRTYPQIFYAEPQRESPTWSEEKGLTVKRQSNPKEATIEAHGLVDGQPTGAHYRLRVYDDVVTLASVNTPEQVKKTTDAWELSDNLGARGEDGSLRAWHSGTRYHFGDTYQDIIDKGALKVRLYPATDDGTADGKPVLLTPEAWGDKKQKQGPATIACQQLLNPAAGNEAMFKKEWLRFIDIRPATLNIYITVDPANSKKKGSDNTAMVVTGIDSGGNKYLLDGFRHKMGLKERWEHLYLLRKRWVNTVGVQMVRVGYEKYGMQSDLEYFEEKMEAIKDSFEIVELSWTHDGTTAKDDRVQRLQPDFAAGRYYLAAITDGETANQKKIREEGQSFRIFKPTKAKDHEGNLYSLNKGFLEEYLTYPFSSKKDFMDSASRIYDMDPVRPIIIDQRTLEPETFTDGS